jgi:hypothetical protein
MICCLGSMHLETRPLPLFLLFSHTFWMMALAFVIRVLKEFGEPTRKALIMDLVPAEQKAGMFGLYYLIRDIVILATAFAGGSLWQLSPAVNLLAATTCGLAGTIYFAIRKRDLNPPASRPTQLAKG